MVEPVKVSILIPVYNCQEWVGRAIESALAQSWPNKEVVIIDDCSTDDSWQVVRQWEGKARIIQARKNGGQNVTRNALTAMSSGEWLCYLDADDELYPTAVEEKMKFADQADAIYGSMEVAYYEEERLTGTKRIRAETYAEPMAAALEWKYPNTTSFMFRKSAVLEVGGWNEGIQNCTDYDLYLKLLLAGKRLVAAPKSITIYRQWSDSQAVYQNAQRRMMTRLMLMWQAVTQMDASAVIRQVFYDSALGVIRSLYPLNPEKAREEYQRLRAWAHGEEPSPGRFPLPFRICYRWLGYEVAEKIAAVTRRMRSSPGKRMFMSE